MSSLPADDLAARNRVMLKKILVICAGMLAFAFAMGVVGGFFPAFRAARLKITTALREV